MEKWGRRIMGEANRRPLPCITRWRVTQSALENGRGVCFGGLHMGHTSYAAGSSDTKQGISIESVIGAITIAMIVCQIVWSYHFTLSVN